MTFHRSPVQRVGIIGAGASGIAAAKALLAERCFRTIEILEQRRETGGLWNYTSEQDSAPVPSIDPNVVEEPRISGKNPVFISAVYDELATAILLETNIPKQLMNFDGFPFSDELPLFLPHAAVRQYVQEYGKEVQHLIDFNTKVIDCRKEGKVWEVLVRDTRTGVLKEKRVYDAVLVAVGHYNIPYIPPVPGLEGWATIYHGSVSHSKNFRKPDSYYGKKVIVVGNSASGTDIAAQICQFSQCPLLQSCRKRSNFSTGTNLVEICEVPEITAFSVSGRSVHFSDGRVEKGVDSVVFCTGYLHSLPFLSSLNTGPHALITDGARVNHVYQHIFYIPDSTLSIIGLPMKVIPFPMAQAAGLLVARVWANRITLPSLDEMCDWENSEVAEKGNGKEFHYFDFPKDADYLDVLGSMCEAFTHEEDREVGIKPPKWGDEQRWTRARLPLIKKAYSEMKGQGIIAKRQEELGFDFKLVGGTSRILDN